MLHESLSFVSCHLGERIVQRMKTGRNVPYSAAAYSQGSQVTLPVQDRETLTELQSASHSFVYNTNVQRATSASPLGRRGGRMLVNQRQRRTNLVLSGELRALDRAHYAPKVACDFDPCMTRQTETLLLVLLSSEAPLKRCGLDAGLVKLTVTKGLSGIRHWNVGH